MNAPAAQRDPVAEALEVARQLTREGIPVFVAPPSASPAHSSGFALPYRWEQTVPDPAALDRWQPGWAVCAVMGHGLDLIDLDLYNNADGSDLDGLMPAIYGTAATASGGVHYFVRSMGVASKNNLFQGIDIKAGTPGGTDHGFAFIAPTVKASKVTGLPATYSWITFPSAAAARTAEADNSGEGLAGMIRAARGIGNSPLNGNAPEHGAANAAGPGALPTPEAFMRPRAWGRYNPETGEYAGDIRAVLAGGRNNGTMRLAAALRGRGGWTLESALEYMDEHVWPLIDQEGHEFTQAEFHATIRAQWRQYPDGYLVQQVQQAQQAQENAQGELVFQWPAPPQEWPIPGNQLQLTDTYLLDMVERCMLRGQFLWARGLGWLRWTGLVWASVDAGIVHVHLGRGFQAWLAICASPPPGPDGVPRASADHEVLTRIVPLLDGPRIKRVADLVHGHPMITREAEAFDAYPNAINTPGQIIDLRTGETYPNNPQWLFTKITSGRYIPGYAHADWEQALTALDPAERKWYQRRIGQAITGHPPSDGIMPVLCGPGENGKALDISTPMLTANRGWTTMGELVAGDEVYGPDGQPAKITMAHPVRYGRPCYRVSTTDDRSVIADAEHLWAVRSFAPTRRAKLPRHMVATTEQLLTAGPVARRRGNSAEFRFRLPGQEALDIPAAVLPMDPYVLGCWIGDGSSSGNGFTNPEPEIIENIRAAGWPVRPLRPGTGDCPHWGIGAGRGGPKAASFQGILRALGVLGNKHIPELYLTAGTAQRLALLQGLMDTDGSCSAGQGQAEFCTTRAAVAEGALYLIRSLGWRVTAKESDAVLNGRIAGRRWRLMFTPDQNRNPFRLPRKAARVRAQAQGRPVSIAAIEPVPSRPVRCITVDRADALYLAGRDLIPTHNTALTTDGPVRALGGFAEMASHKLITSQQAGKSEHSTEMADLRGQRLLIGEELSEGRSIDVTALKRIMDVGRIRARKVYQDNVTFTASHSLFVTTNYVPVINETDHGTWRRLALVKFRYTFRKSAEDIRRPDTDRLGDPGLKQRIRQNPSGQHDAIVTWAIDGARQWYDEGFRDAPLTEKIIEDTLAWRIEADRVLGFCHHFLTPDPSACILASDMLDQFNAWIAQGGHAAWSRETFMSRFAGHEWVTRHGVENRRTRALAGLVPWPVPGSFSPGNRAVKQATVWTGVRPKTPDELGESVSCAVGAEPPVTFPISSHEAKVTEPSAPTAQAPTEGASVSVPEPSAGPPPATTGSDQPPGTPGPDSPPAPEPPAATDSNPPQPEKPRAKAPRKSPKRIGPDPELAGPILSLPAVVMRNGTVLPCSVGQAGQILRAGMAAGGGALTVDVEHTGYPIGHPDYALKTVQLGDENLAVVFAAADTYSQIAIRELLAEATRLHAHSATADLVPLMVAGLCTEEAWGRMFDTVLHAKLADPQLAGSDADALKELAADIVPGAVSPDADKARAKLFASGKWLKETDALTPLERSGWAQVDQSCQTMIVYAGSDVLDTAPLPALLPPVDAAVMERERGLQRMCARVTYRGMRLDPDHTHAKLAEHRAAKAEIGGRISGQYQIENPGSAQQVAEVFARLGVQLPHTAPSPKFPQGQPSTARAVLLPIAKRGAEGADLAQTLLDFRHHATVLALLLEPFGVQADHGDGRVRPTIYTLAADTGRTSCVRPNLQQLSRQGGVRACITADPGMMIISADFNAVELRVAAALSQDAALIEMIIEGDRCRAQQQLAKIAGDAQAAEYWKQQAALYDLHWRIARQVWGPDATKEDRYNAKRGVFGHLYGAGTPNVAGTLGISMAEAQAVKDTLAAQVPGVESWSGQIRQYVRGGGTSIQAYSGRTIWLDKRQPHKGPNYLIQGSGKELLTDALLKWRQTRWGDSVILPVHDEVLAVVPEDDAAAATEALVEAMSSELHGVPIVAEASEPSYAWADAS